jgi:hypothetical protein
MINVSALNRPDNNQNKILVPLITTTCTRTTAYKMHKIGIKGKFVPVLN